MVDHTDRFRPLKMTPGCYRIPDGHIVPNPPRPAPEPAPTRYEWRVFWMTLGVVVLGVVIGVLR